jgi:hypothetical protein
VNRKTVRPPPLVPDLGEGKIIWTAAAIGQRIGCSADFVRGVVAREPGTPIKVMGKRLYVFERELMSWMRDRNPL